MPGDLPVVGVVAAGGAIGAVSRYAAARVWPTPHDSFPWTTLGVNALGCAAIGVLMVLVTEAWVAHRLLRPFLGAGVLGGFTTFSAYALDVRHLVDAGRPVAASAYLVGTVLAALLLVWAAAAATRMLLPRVRSEAT